MEGRPPEPESPRPEGQGEPRRGEAADKPEARPGEVVERVERPAEPADPEARPATLGEVRTLRRWLAVAGVWAVAASAIAVIALLEARKEDEPTGPAPVTGSQLGRVQDDLNERLDGLEGRIDELPTSGDVRKLERRLKRAENAAADTRGDVRSVNTDLDELTTRVEDVEQAQEAAANEETDTETTPENP